MERRVVELTSLFKRLYEDNVLGRITNEQFRMLSADYNAEQKNLDIGVIDSEMEKGELPVEKAVLPDENKDMQLLA